MADNRKLIQIAVSGVVALFFVNYYLKARERSIEGGFAMIDVLAAARDIPSRSEIRPDQITTKQVPSKYVEPGAIIIKDPGTEFARIRSKISVAAIPAGGTIISSNLNDPSPDGTGIAPIVPPGKRGVILRLGNLDVQQLILPRDHIDILATLPLKTKEGQSRGTFTILQNILVLGVGKDLVRPTETTGARREAQDSLVLTLALTPYEAQQMDLARKESDGDISVIVRPQNDNAIQPLMGVGPDSLLDHPAPSPKLPTPSKKP
jgi:Flp pilus assembly protein CpaB